MKRDKKPDLSRVASVFAHIRSGGRGRREGGRMRFDKKKGFC